MAKGNKPPKKAASKQVDVSKLRPHERRAHDAQQASAAASAAAK